MGPPRSGIVLICTSALLALLAFLAAAFVQATRWQNASAGADKAGRASRIAAECGLHYAAARLWENPLSSQDAGQMLIPENTRNDWAARGSEPLNVPPSRLLNPSYARGEFWRDADASGSFSGDPYDDINGNGRFDVRSGRLRGGSNEGPVFFLRVRSAGSRACVNSGETGSPADDHDLDGILNAEDTVATSSNPAYGTDLNGANGDDDQDQIPNWADPDYAGPIGNGVPDWSDPDFAGNRHVVNLLDNLGAVLELADVHPEKYAPQATPASAIQGLGEIQTSFLGRRIIGNRPRGGYSSIEQVADALRPFYAAADVARVLHHLSVHGEIVPIPLGFEGMRFGQDVLSSALQKSEVRHEFHARLDFNTIPCEILEASLRHLSHSGYEGFNISAPPKTDRFTRIGAEEAKKMAAFLAARRPVRTWKRLLEIMVAGDAGIWKPDPLYPGDPQIPEKENLVLAQFDANWCWPDLFTGRRNSLEVPRDAVGADATHVIGCFKRGLACDLNSAPATFPDGGIPTVARNIPPRMTTEMGLSPLRSDFSVDAEGVSGGTRFSCRTGGDFSRSERSVLFTGQQDFEPILGEGPNPARKIWRGGEVYDDGLRRAERTGTQTRPRFPVARFDGANLVTNFPASTFTVRPDEYRYPYALGWVGLSSWQWDPGRLVGGIAGLAPGNLTLSIPFNEDQGTAAPWDNTHWLDNVWDPYAAARPTPKPYLIDIGAANTQAGICLTPDGLQYRANLPEAPGKLNYIVRWDCKTAFGDGFFPADAGGPLEGTIACWIPVGDGQDMPAPKAEGPTTFCLRYGFNVSNSNFMDWIIPCIPENGQSINIWHDYQWGWGTYDVFEVPPPAGTPADALASTGWRCITLTFRRVGTDTHLFVYVDGRCCNASNPCIVSGISPENARMELCLCDMGYPVNDLMFFDRILDDAQIAALAAKPRYASSGRYVSPRIAFDAARIPEGAFITGFSWDGFIPEAIGGAMTMHATGFDVGGALLQDSSPVTWSDENNAMRAHFFKPIPGCRRAGFTVEFAADPAPVDLCDAGGGVLVAGAKILRETPILEEFRLLYRTAKPRWTGLSGR